MKKGAIISALISSVLAIGIATAQELPAPPIAMNDMLTFLSQIFSGILVGGAGILSADLFARLLLLIVLIVVLRKPAELITKEPGTATIIAVIVSILGIRFLSSEVIQGILLPYGTIAIVVSTFIPFMLLTYFLINMPYSWVRKIGWIMTLVVFIGLWWMRWTDIGNMAYVYLIVAILSIILFFFDGTIQRWLTNIKLKGRMDTEAYIEIARLEKQMDDYVQLLSAASSGSKEAAALDKKIFEVRKRIAHLLTKSK